MDAELLDELERQHREVEELLDQLSEAKGAKAQTPLTKKLTEMLDRHMQIEESDVYPQVATFDNDAAEEAVIEHGLAREGLKTLHAMIGEPGFGAAVAMLAAGISHHVDEEEGEVFPQLREQLGLVSADGETKKELYDKAREAGIEGRGSMSKDELAAALQSSRR